MLYRVLSKHMHSCFLQPLIKEKSPMNKKWTKQIIVLIGATKLTLPSLQKTGRANEDPNLSIDDRRKLYCPTSNNETPINGVG